MCVLIGVLVHGANEWNSSIDAIGGQLADKGVRFCLCSNSISSGQQEIAGTRVPHHGNRTVEIYDRRDTCCDAMLASLHGLLQQAEFNIGSTAIDERTATTGPIVEDFANNDCVISGVDRIDPSALEMR